MDILIKEIEYLPGIPAEASLCRVDRSLPHSHPRDLEIVFCIEGEIHLVASDQKALLRPGQVHSIDYRDIHYLYSDTDNLALIFHLDLQNIPYDWEQIQYVFFACESNHCYAYQNDAMNAVKDLILSFSYGYMTGKYSPEMYAEPVEFFSFYLLQYFNWFNYENQDEYMNEDLYERFHRVLAYCLDHYDQKISISQLAKAEHISKNYFSQFLSHTVFRSFSTMIKYIRCYEAEYLLLTTDKPNSEISYECGFSDPKYFYSAFRQLWGCTPSEHRTSYAKYYEECLKHYAESPFAKPGEVLYEDGEIKYTGDDIPGQVRMNDEAAAQILKEYMARWHLAKTFGSDQAEPGTREPAPMIDFALRLQ